MRSAVLVLCCLVLAGCETEVPCDIDNVGCSPTEDLFALDPTCTLTGPLLVTLGTGTSAFKELPSGELPALEHGPQGGSHSFLAIRVANPAPVSLGEQTQLLRVHFVVSTETAGPCPTVGGVTTGEPVDIDGAPGCAQRSTSRTVVFGARAPLHRVDGAVEELSVLFQWDPYGPGRWAVTATATDPCGRTGSDKSAAVVP